MKRGTLRRRVPLKNKGRLSEYPDIFVVDEFFVNLPDTFGKFNAVPPAEMVQLTDIHELAWSAIRFGGIPDQLAVEPDNVFDK